MAPTVRTWHRPPALRAETPESRVLQRFQRVLAQTPLTPRTQGGPGTSASASSSLPEKLQALPENVAAIQSADAEAQLTGVTWFRKQLSIERSPPIDEVIRSGVVPRLVELLATARATPQLQFEAAWALTNIASGKAEHTAQVIDNGAVPIFVQLLSSPDDNVRGQAVWALGNISGDSPQTRDLVLQSQALVPLLGQLTESSPVSILRNATWTLSNLCRGKPQPPFHMVSPALPCLARLISVVGQDEEVLTDACWALSYLSGGTNDKIQAVIDAGVVRQLVELAHRHPSPKLQTPVLRTVGNIVTGDDRQTQIAIDCGALPCLLHLLDNHKKSIRKEACWTISNITAGNKDQIQKVIDCGLVPPLVQLLATADFDIKKEAAWAISNATTCGTAEQIRYLVTQQCIQPLCGLLTMQDDRLIIVALEGIEHILKLGEEEKEKSGAEMNDYSRLVEEADGMNKLETLRSSANDDIYGRVIAILETYFGLDEESETDAAASPASAFSFTKAATSSSLPASSAAAAPAFSFASKPAAPSSAAASPAFSFAPNAAASTGAAAAGSPAFSFAKPAASSAASSPASSTTAPPAFSFANPAASTGAAASPAFSFAKPAASSGAAAASPAFSFASKPATTAAAPAPAFLFATKMPAFVAPAAAAASAKKDEDEAETGASEAPQQAESNDSQGNGQGVGSVAATR